MDIKFYSTGCPKCKVLELKLNQLGQPYKKETDVEKIVEIGKAHGILSTPILEVDGKFYDFTNAINLLRTL